MRTRAEAETDIRKLYQRGLSIMRKHKTPRLSNTKLTVGSAVIGVVALLASDSAKNEENTEALFIISFLSASVAAISGGFGWRRTDGIIRPVINLATAAAAGQMAYKEFMAA